MANLSEVIEFIWRSECESWRVVKRDGRKEAFDPLTLLGSLIESEVPIDFACKIFDDAVDRISNSLIDGTITHDAIDSIVVRCLIDCRHQDAASWVSNYENIFGPDLESLTAEKDYIVVRHASELRGHILAELAAMIGVEPGEVEKILGSAETSLITNRFIKIIRYCGFYKVKRSFLRAFCEELSDSSVKGIFPPMFLDEIRAEQTLDSGELLLSNARISAPSNPKRALSLLDLALEDVGTVGVYYCGLVPRTASRSSFDQLVRLFKTVGQIPSSAVKAPVLPKIDAIKQKIVGALEARSIPLKHFVADCEELLAARNRGDVRKALDLAYRVLRNARIVFLPNRTLTGLSAYTPEADPPVVYLEMLRDLVSAAGISANIPEGECYVDIDIRFGFHELLEMGRTIRVRTSFVLHGEVPPASWLDGSISDLRERGDVISLLVTNYDFSEPMLDIYRGVIKNLKRCVCPVSREQLEKALRRPEEVRDLILRQFDILVPNAKDMRAKVFPDTGIDMPKLLSSFEKSAIRDAFAFIRSGRVSTGELSLVQATEASLRENVLLASAISMFGIKRRDAPKAVLPTFSQQGMGECISWIRKLGGLVLPSEYKHIKNLIPTSSELKRLDGIKQERNQFAHSTSFVDEEKGRKFLSECTWALGALAGYRRQFTRAVCAGRRGEQLVFITDGDVKTVEGSRKHSPASHVATGCCVYLNNDPMLFPVIHAVGVCSVCGQQVEIDSVGTNNTFQHCGRLYNLDRHWEELVSQYQNYREAQMSNFPEYKSKRTANMQAPVEQTQGGIFSSWLRPVAEAVATAAGPLGGPLKGLLKRQDDIAAAKLNAKIDNVIASQGRIEANLIQEFLQIQGLAEGMAKAFGWAIADRLNLQLLKGPPPASGYDTSDGGDAKFVSITGIEEQVLVKALVNIYESDMDLFFADLSAAKCNIISRVSRSGKPLVDLNSFVRSLRGQSPDVIQSIFSSLHRSHPGCEVFETIGKSLAGFLNEYQKGSTTSSLG